MAKVAIVKASTNVTVYLFIQDSSSLTGEGLTGLVFNSSGLTCYQVRPLAAAAALTLATQTVTGVHSDGGFVEVDATNMAGIYRLDLSDAICATGVDSVVVHLQGAANMVPLSLEIQLTDFDLNSANPDVNVVQVSGDSGAADNAEAFFDGTGYAGTGNVIPTVTTLTGHTAQTGDNYARLGAPAGASVSADIAALPTVANILTTQMTEAYAADGTAPTLAEAIFLIQQTIGEFAISSTTLTAKKLDGSTTAATYTLDSATDPTSRTRAT